jgi:hypothetical protein
MEAGKRRKGSWSLGPNGNLRYRGAGKDEEAELNAPLIAAEPDALVVGLTARQSDQKTVTRLAKLTGTWKADAKNRLVFEVERESGKNDELTFQGLWEINKAQEIVYRLRRTRLKTKTKRSTELVFRGFWDLSEKNRLTYVLSGDSDSAFRFRGAFQTKSILAKAGQIRYQIGLEAAGRRSVRTVTLFGRWLVSRDLGVSFETESADGVRRTILFGGDFRLNDRDRIAVDLKHRDGAPLGVELVLTREVLGGDGHLFLRLKKSLEGSRVEAGAAARW